MCKWKTKMEERKSTQHITVWTNGTIIITDSRSLLLFLSLCCWNEQYWAFIANFGLQLWWSDNQNNKSKIVLMYHWLCAKNDRNKVVWLQGYTDLRLTRGYFSNEFANCCRLNPRRRKNSPNVINKRHMQIFTVNLKKLEKKYITNNSIATITITTNIIWTW